MSSVLSSRIQNSVPRLVRTLVNKAEFRPVPSARDSIASPTDFLKAIGRSSETKLEAPEKWEDFWRLDGNALKKANIPVTDRRYILWSMQKYRLGEAPEDFAHPPKPKKKIRGRGPAVQFGKRIRSRRL
ncbi:hypothetical protein QCA50_006662 [Cerrena zonata]|uniref:Small ribosomal subunit protein mS41 n=1 Tax=Cerrena zonata TaxID=2478898 RepID=A0AAW0GIF2_9APHY